MNTAQGGVLASLVYVVVYVASLRAVYRQLGTSPLRQRPHLVAVLLWLVVAVPSLLQLAWPRIYGVLSRQPTLVEHGEWWRLLTSVLVQDGGVVGTVYNLVTLALTVSAATALWRPVRAAAVFIAGALVYNLPATYLWRQAGGGNSGATFFLVTSMLGVLLVQDRTRRARTAALVVAASGVVLLVVLRDAHGEAVLTGLTLGTAVAAALNRRRAAMHRTV